MPDDNPDNTPGISHDSAQTQTAAPPTGNSLQPSIIVILGITGDLARRYLMPSLYHLFKQGLLHEKTQIIGTSRHVIYLDDIFNTVEMCVSETDKTCDPVTLARMHSQAHVFQLDTGDAASYQRLRELLDSIEAEQGVCMNRLYYLSIPPAGYAGVIENMGKTGLNGSCPHGTAQTRLLAEKPFGHDLASAQRLIDITAQVFDEDQIFRIDHYLAKETAQNIMTFRFENPLFQAAWHSRHISGIDIVASEKIGIEGRADFYEQQGALRDFIQNHLLQLLAVVAMEQPADFSSQAVHAAKLQLLRAVQPITATQVASQTRRGQYAGYRDETGNPDSHVETFAAIRTTIDSDRWRGVPVTIRTGKAMADRFTSVTVSFSGPDVPLGERTARPAATATDDWSPAIRAGNPDNAGQASGRLSGGGQSEAADMVEYADGRPNHRNDLVFRIQPDEGISISLEAKKPGFDQAMQRVTMQFSYAQSFDGPQPTAYERVLVDAIRGDRTLFASSQEVLAAWRVVDAVVHAWQASGDGLISYRPGTPIDEL